MLLGEHSNECSENDYIGGKRLGLLMAGANVLQINWIFPVGMLFRNVELPMQTGLRRIIYLLLAACWAGVIPTNSHAEYLVRSGDVLELQVAGSDSMQQRLPIDVDGTTRIPLIGSIRVDGLRLDEINKIVKEKLKRKTLSRVSASGQAIREHFDPEQIIVRVAQYRPIYVTGDVAKPGEQPFRPGLTVGQAVALAGGYNVLKTGNADLLAKTYDWQSELNTLLITLMRHSYQLIRIKSELADENKLPEFNKFRSTIASEIAADLARVETEKFLHNRAKFNQEISFLRAAISKGKARLDILDEQQSKEKGGLEADTEEYERLSQLGKKGTTTSARVTNARRNILFSSTRYLQTAARISAVARDQEAGDWP